MYGFVEKELADILVQEGVIASYEPFATSNGESVALLDINSFNIVRDVVTTLSGHNMVCVVPSDIRGMFITLYPFWMKEELFDALTPGTVKESALYLAIRTEPSATRFVWNAFTDNFRRALLTLLDRPTDVNGGEEADAADEPQDINGIAIENNEAGVVEEPPPPPPEPEDIQFLKKMSRTWGLEFKQMDAEGVGEIWYTWNGTMLNRDTIRMAGALGKHIVVLYGKEWAGRVKLSMRELLHEKEVREKIIFIYVSPAHAKFYSPVTSMVHTVFGFDSPMVYQLHSDDANRYTANESSLGAAFADFDYAYRDYKTGVIWALQRGNEVYFTLELGDASADLCATLVNELIERFGGKLSYDEMVRRDIEHFNATAQHDEKLFVDLAVTSSNSFISQLKSEYLVAQERYIKAMGEAMENAKIAQRLEDNISSIDEQKLAEEERARCEKMFKDVLVIPKVSAVKVTGSLINVYTKNIYAHNEEKKVWHDIGTFHIQIGMCNTRYDSEKTVRIINTKHQIAAFHGRMQAPHVFEDGHLCHGNIVAPMIDAYKRRDLYQIVLILIMFLENANLDDAAGAYLYKWPIVTEEVATAPGNEDAKCIDLFGTEEEKEFDDQLDIPIHI